MVVYHCVVSVLHGVGRQSIKIDTFVVRWHLICGANLTDVARLAKERVTSHKVPITLQVNIYRELLLDLVVWHLHVATACNRKTSRSAIQRYNKYLYKQKRCNVSTQRLHWNIYKLPNSIINVWRLNEVTEVSLVIWINGSQRFAHLKKQLYTFH